ncbi:MAG TPA: hypothetical protein VM204_07955 [Gaiellaceae bacterium]|nr:hypothetical protein [Gaiellaceae bacterium]
MVLRTLALALVTSSLLAVTAGCSADAADQTPAEKGTSKESDSKRGSSEDSTDPDDDRGPRDSTPDDPAPTPSKKKQNGGQCEESADCESDFCVFQGDGLGMCTATCSDDIDCSLGERCVKLSNAPQKACVPE